MEFILHTPTEPLDTFQSTKQRLDTILGDLANFFQSLGTKSRAEDLKAAQAKLHSEQFNLVVAGTKKQGKSTLFNAMLGEQVLPTKPMHTCTAVPIRVQYGFPRRAECHRGKGLPFKELDLEKTPKALYDNATPKDDVPGGTEFSMIDV